jgi:predicted HNH restriction endonuclease
MVFFLSFSLASDWRKIPCFFISSYAVFSLSTLRCNNNYFKLTPRQKVATSIEITGQGEDRSYWENLVRTAKARLTEKGILASKLGNGLCKLQRVDFVSSEVKIQRGSRTSSNKVNIDKKTLAKRDIEKIEKTPVANDIGEIGPAARIETATYRILRDTAIARRIKVLHNFCCQICGDRIQLSNGKYYIEAHHIKPLGRPHNGPDIQENVICVCPNHHVQLDYGAIAINLSDITKIVEHNLGKEYINYHNTIIFGNQHL